MNYRFEHHYQTHKLQLGIDSAVEGLSEMERRKLADHAGLLASPLKRMEQVLECKRISIAHVAEIGLYSQDELCRISQFRPIK